MVQKMRILMQQDIIEFLICKTILRHPEKYHVKQAIKLGTYNIGRPDESFPILTIPFYMCFLLREY